VLRRLAVNYPPIMFHPLNTITAYKGQIIYDTPATEAKAATPIPQLTWIPAKGVQTPPPAAQNPADLQALFVPSAPQTGPPSGSPPAGAGPAPGPAPGSAFGPLPGPPPNQAPAMPSPAGPGGGG